MNEEAKERRNAYMREWRKKNKDKVKQAQERYWEKKAKSQKEVLKEKNNTAAGGTGILRFEDM